MTHQLQSEESIFLRALDIPDEAGRTAFLREICGEDRNLRAGVEELLRAHGKSGDVLDLPDSLDSTIDIAEKPGAEIGPYKLLQQIGEGGFGIVFLADQDRPVKRRVALKVIKPGMDSRQVIARFEAERQALALMDHPNIAKVYDAGTTDNGRPYFVMELVHGVPITEYCDQSNLTTRERLELFVSVCQAVQHAHQKGVIHRDMKPTNVLVSIQDGQAAPKVIDFGVAKAINQQLTEHTLLTAFAQMVGTPLYMSPEQAELSPLGVDTRSDIYSLGSLLYELLTSMTPFDKDRLHAASYDELRRIIRDEEPPRPSARISTLAADMAITVGEHRRTDRRRLQQTFRGELDWIVMKCLEKDRNRRYESAGSLAADVERYLRDEPVEACPPSATYRLRKFIRRNKAAAAFVFMGICAAGALALSNVQTRNSERRAVIENAKALAVSDLLQNLLRSANPDEVKDAEYTVRQLFDDFSANFEVELTDQPEVEAETRATIGRAYWRLGVPDKAEPHLMKALELRRQLFGRNHESVAEILVEVAWCRNEQGRLRDAEQAAREALGIYSDCGTTGSPVFRASAVLQRVLISMHRYEAAESVTDDVLAQAQASRSEFPEIAVILHGQADLLLQLGRFAEAEKAAGKAVDLHRRVNGPGHPETAWGLLALGRTLQEQKKFSEAEVVVREALGVFRERYRGSHHSLESTMRTLKQVLEALEDESALEALARDELSLSELKQPGIWFQLANSFTELGNLQWRSAKSEDAEVAFRRAREIYQEHAAEIVAESMPTHLVRIVEDYRRIANHLDASGRKDVAMDFLRNVSHSAQTLSNPADLAHALYHIALAQLCLGDQDGYQTSCKALFDLPISDYPETIRSRPVWTSCLAPNALDDPNLAVSRAEEIAATCPPAHRHFWLTVLGAALYRSTEYKRAAQHLEEANGAYVSLAPSSFFEARNYERLFRTMAKWQLGDKSDARRLFAETLPAVDEELQSPASGWNRRATLELLRAEAEALMDAKKADVAVENRSRPDQRPDHNHSQPDQP